MPGSGTPRRAFEINRVTNTCDKSSVGCHIATRRPRNKREDWRRSSPLPCCRNRSSAPRIARTRGREAEDADRTKLPRHGRRRPIARGRRSPTHRRHNPQRGWPANRLRKKGNGFCTRLGVQWNKNPAIEAGQSGASIISADTKKLSRTITAAAVQARAMIPGK